MPKSYLIDMDGVIVRGSELIPGADAFLDRLHQRAIKFLILTNNPLYTPRDLLHRLQRIGVNVTADHIYTSALATAQFLKKQLPDGTAFVIPTAPAMADWCRPAARLRPLSKRRPGSSRISSASPTR